MCTSVRRVCTDFSISATCGTLAVVTIDCRDLVTTIAFFVRIYDIECCSHVFDSHWIAEIKLLKEYNGVEITHSKSNGKGSGPIPANAVLVARNIFRALLATFYFIYLVRKREIKCDCGMCTITRVVSIAEHLPLDDFLRLGTIGKWLDVLEQSRKNYNVQV